MPSHNHTFSRPQWYASETDGKPNWIFGTTGSTVTQVDKTTLYTGGSQAHNNLQPYVVSNFIIKAKQTHAILSEVINSLSSDSENDALSAKMGKALNTQLSNLKSYSTEETLTGETWIDGKPIYRKTFIIEAIASGGQVSIDVSSLNIDIFFIDYSKTSYVLTNSFKVSASYSTVENYAQIVDTLLTYNKVFVRCKTGTGQIGIRQGYLTIEYTKTTD